MGYLRRTLNYRKRIISSDPTHMMSMSDPVTICVKTPKINTKHSLAKGLTELIL